MIKMRGSYGDGKPLLLFGLTRRNVDKLLAGQPILVDGAELAMPGWRVVIVGGETKRDIVDELELHGLMPKGAADAVRSRPDDGD